MTTSAPLRLTAEDKLDLLRKLDPAGCWRSLDDQRYCTQCDHVISGRQIEVAGGTRAHAPLRLECPTADCAATPQDWTTRGSHRARRSGHVDGSVSDSDAGSHDAGYVQIRAESEGISITHNGRIAVVRRTRSGRVTRLLNAAQLIDAPPLRRRIASWLIGRAASVASDCRGVLSLLRPRSRGQFFIQ